MNLFENKIPEVDKKQNVLRVALMSDQRFFVRTNLKVISYIPQLASCCFIDQVVV